jgi:hypothetical protein
MSAAAALLSEAFTDALFMAAAGCAAVSQRHDTPALMRLLPRRHASAATPLAAYDSQIAMRHSAAAAFYTPAVLTYDRF